MPAELTPTCADAPHLLHRAVEGVAVAGHQVRGHAVEQEDALVVIRQLVGRVVGAGQPRSVVRNGLWGSMRSGRR